MLHKFTSFPTRSFELAHDGQSTSIDKKLSNNYVDKSCEYQSQYHTYSSIHRHLRCGAKPIVNLSALCFASKSFSAWAIFPGNSVSILLTLATGISLKPQRCLEHSCIQAQAWGKGLKKTKFRLLRLLSLTRTTKTIRPPPSQMFRFGPTRPRSRLTVATTVRHSMLRILSRNGGLGTCILMLLPRTPGLLLQKKGNIAKTLKSFLPPLPGLLLPQKRGDFTRIQKTFFLPQVPVKECAQGNLKTFQPPISLFSQQESRF